MSNFISDSGSPPAGTTTYATFPSTVSPAVWFNGNMQAYSDSAGTIPVSSGLIRNIADGVSGNWIASSDDQRPLRDSNSVRFECIGPAGGGRMDHPAVGGLQKNALTIAATFMPRDNSFAGAIMGIIYAPVQGFGISVPGAQLWVWTPGGLWVTGLVIVQGVQNTMVVRYTPTTVDITLNAGGIVTSASTSQTIASAALTDYWIVGEYVGGTGCMYGSIPQSMVIPKIVSDSERDALIAWMINQPVPPAYPNDRTLISYVGDSITRMTACVYGFGYPFLSLYNIRNDGYILTENCDTAIGGTGVTGVLGPNTTFTYSTRFYSPARAKNIMVVLLGTNDIANSNSVAYTLYGTGGSATTGLYPMCDAARTQGWKVVLLTIGPRSDNPSFQTTYNARRAQVNADILTNGLANHADRVVDTTQIVNFGRDGDSDNPAYYSADKIHPLNTGHALLAPYVTSALVSLL